MRRLITLFRARDDSRDDNRGGKRDDNRGDGRGEKRNDNRGDGRGDDSGAVAVTVAVLLTGGVLIGAAALVVDVGGLYAKREQLQSGADAAAWAIAEECIGTDGTCTFDTMQALADGKMSAQLYGPGPGNNTSAAAAAQYCVSWQDCTVAWSTGVDCPRDRMTFADSVEVRTFYRDGDSLIMPAPLAGVFAGERKGARIGACSRVTWGAPEKLRVAALAVAESCVGTLYRAELEPDRREELGLVPLRSLPEAAGDTAIPATGGADDSCGFVRLDEAEAEPDCRVEPTPPEAAALTAAADGTSAACTQVVRDAVEGAEPLLVPVYRSGTPPVPDEGLIYSADTAAASVTVVGFAALVPRPACRDGDCLDGYFTRVLAPRSQPRFTSEGARDLGVTVIGRTG